jgi:hypothetical protein
MDERDGAPNGDRPDATFSWRLSAGLLSKPLLVKDRG